ncbi:MAG TPA: Ku protein, partial [Thalassobaculum sp.]
TSERIAFHTLNRATGNRVRRQFVDQETGEPVPPEDQVKGYEVAQGEYVVLEPDEVAAAVPDSDKTLAVDAFIPCAGIDHAYFDKPYYLAPSGAVADEAFSLLREGMRRNSVAALARTVLFRRVRTVLIRAHGDGMIANTLNFDYEVRSAEEAFSGIPERKIKGEMLDLARHIIDTKTGAFAPGAFDDRYEAALADLIRAKIEGRPVEAPKRRAEPKVVDLMEALRQSAGAATSKQRGKAKQSARTNAGARAGTDGKRAAAPRRKAG